MKQVFLHKANDLTVRHDSQRKEVLFFADPHFLFFYFFWQPHKWHIWFCPTHKPTLRKTKRATLPTLY
jgi:hypothetical protein